MLISIKNGPMFSMTSRFSKNRFHPSRKVFLYNLHLYLFSGKLRSRWTGPFIVKQVFPYEAIELENPKNGASLKINGQCLKPFLKSFDSEDIGLPLTSLDYQN